ncbi:uncharacterized skeletal organic matrix protein 5-like [Pocillopora verrucosa]|uniref:uncharacterized skeletal organic matrix protein 5-like n=1 Tax=Pocillopora verrucosa TaxID=203993 RepID=UPI003341A4B3
MQRFVPRSETYLDQEGNPCGTAQCPPNSRCYSDFEHETYLCVCSPGFTGDKCESAEAASKGYDPENPAISCEDVLLNRPESRSGAYYLKTEKGGVAHTYCHMDVIPGCGGGGWTLVMKIDGNEDTFSYHSKYWSNKNTFGEISGTTGFDNEETKMPSYWSNNFTQICLGMRVGNVTEWLVINKQANSLHSLVADNNYKPTSLGRDKWKSLIDESSLQLECNKEGFNVKCPTAREHSASTRIGIISNNEKHCNSCDSRIGIGMGGTRGGVDVTNSCGNEADPFKSDNGKKHIKANCYILIK